MTTTRTIWAVDLPTGATLAHGDTAQEALDTLLANTSHECSNVQANGYFNISNGNVEYSGRITKLAKLIEEG